MKKTEDAKFLEMVVSNNDMRSFVCETRKDLQLFLSEVHRLVPHRDSITLFEVVVVYSLAGVHLVLRICS